MPVLAAVAATLLTLGIGTALLVGATFGLAKTYAVMGLLWLGTIGLPTSLGVVGVAALGGPQATGIPDTGSPPVTSQPKLSATRRASQLTFAWDAGVTGFILQATDNLANPNWQAVSGVNSNSISITVGVRAQFYRLKQSP